MKRYALLFSTIAAALGVVAAADAADRSRDLTHEELVSHIESAYPGKVTSIQRDTASEERLHYHVLVQLPDGALARFDVDAATRKATRHASGPVPPGAATPGEAAMLVATMLRGSQVTMVEFDASDGAAPHYDIDVRLPTGVAQLRVEAATRWIGWRQPPVLVQASKNR